MPTKKPVGSTIPEKQLKLYSTLLSHFPDIEQKGVTMPYTSHNGNMFSFLNPKGELALRLSAEDRDKFIAKFKTKLALQHGTVLKEYVHVPDELFAKVTEMKKYMTLSIAYARSLKSKKKA
jgi:hypothetical protein